MGSVTAAVCLGLWLLFLKHWPLSGKKHGWWVKWLRTTAPAAPSHPALTEGGQRVTYTHQDGKESRKYPLKICWHPCTNPEPTANAPSTVITQMAALESGSVRQEFIVKPWINPVARTHPCQGCCKHWQSLSPPHQSWTKDQFVRLLCSPYLFLVCSTSVCFLC